MTRWTFVGWRFIERQLKLCKHQQHNTRESLRSTTTSRLRASETRLIDRLYVICAAAKSMTNLALTPWIVQPTARVLLCWSPKYR